ncbi:hypothetical protein [Anaerocolumna xylanovorans]|uniref:ThiS family protein n=1 Tax=Anaerocolumna xylanovorans DSM 12503 TaxID=1121345 RepID=A0A1M7YLP5_9FIRM|nr:hypothetical protein [Anaerocolumna xylanovorans]SHO53553.1 hypothetical protein SAMN02745217_04160 [Anaerocolumna xylanovorans DSM 12503]
MNLKVVLPSYLCEDANENELNVCCSNLQGLYSVLLKECSGIVNKIFDEDKMLKRGVILALDGKMINKSNYDQIEFGEHSVLEILLQLAGG